MESTLKRIFHRRGHSSPVEAHLSPSSIQTSPYHHTKPGAPPTQGKAPLHGHSRSPSAASQPTNLKLSRGRDAHRRSLSLRKSPPHNPVSSNNLAAASASRTQGLLLPVQRPSLPTSPEETMPRHVGQTTTTTTNTNTNTTTSPLPGTAITSDDATYLDSPVDTNGSLGLEHMTLGGDKHLMTRPSRHRYSQDVAERNVHNQYEDSAAVPVVPDDSHSEDVAMRNMSTDSPPESIDPVQEKSEVANAPTHKLDENEYSGEVLPVDGHKARAGADGAVVDPMNMDGAVRPIPGSFPSEYGDNCALSSVAPKAGDTSSPNALPQSTSTANGTPTRSYLVQDAAEKPSLEGVVDLRSTFDTSYHEHYAPAVVHETVHPHTHHIREERIFREIHTHDIHHRILPIVDVQVLPARHFLADPASATGLTEIPASAVPARAGARQNWLVAETASRLPEQAAPAPRDFTARAWDAELGDEKTYVSAEGVPRTETTWVHAPRLETGARDSGQSVPFYFSSPSRVAAARRAGAKGKQMDGVEGSRVDGEALEEGGEPRLRDLAGGVRDAPFDECAAFEDGLKREETAFI